MSFYFVHCIGSLGRKIIHCINDFCPAVTQKGNVLLAVYATPRHRDGLLKGLLKNNKSFVSWPRHYFEAEIRMTKGFCGPAPQGLPGKMVAALSSDIDGATKALLEKAKWKGDDKNSWWFGMRESCFVGVYCSHETEEVLTNDYKTPVLQMFPDDPKNLLPRRVCSRSNHAWVVAVGDTSEYPTFSSFIDYCKSIQVYVEQDGRSSFTARVTDPNWGAFTATVEK
jgi:hypothetical protein